VNARKPLLPELSLFLALAGALWFVVYHARTLGLPEGLQPLNHGLYRLLFWALAPAMAVVSLVHGQVDSQVITYSLAVAVVTTLGWWWLFRVLRRLKAVASTQRRTDPQRRTLLQACAGVAGLGLLGAVGYGSVFGVRRIRVQHWELRVAALPAGLEGLRLVHITDTHYGQFVDLAFLREVVRAANACLPHLVVLTGDYVYGSPRAIAAGIGVFSGLTSTWGAVAVLGNHDHWEGAPQCRAAFAQAGILLLDNGRRFLSPSGWSEEASREALCIAGVGDLWEDEVDFGRALADVPDWMPRLVLSHNPDAAERVPEGMRVDLMLSGHTHGGQVRLPGLGAPMVPSAFGQKYVRGLCAGPRCPVLVSQGVGLAVLPARLGAMPEIGVVTLRRVA